MNKEKLEQMASSISTKVLSKYSEIEQANMPSIICEEVSIESIKATLNLPEVKAMREALVNAKQEYWNKCYEGSGSVKSMTVNQFDSMIDKALADLEGVIE